MAFEYAMTCHALNMQIVPCSNKAAFPPAMQSTPELHAGGDSPAASLAGARWLPRHAGLPVASSLTPAYSNRAPSAGSQRKRAQPRGLPASVELTVGRLAGPSLPAAPDATLPQESPRHSCEAGGHGSGPAALLAEPSAASPASAAGLPEPSAGAGGSGLAAEASAGAADGVMIESPPHSKVGTLPTPSHPGLPTHLSGNTVGNGPATAVCQEGHPATQHTNPSGCPLQAGLQRWRTAQSEVLLPQCRWTCTAIPCSCASRERGRQQPQQAVVQAPASPPPAALGLLQLRRGAGRPLPAQQRGGGAARHAAL